jgi:acetoin utilization deacetylase AcuC-like enzyme
MSTGLVWDERFAWFDAGRGTASGAFLRPLPAADTPGSKERIRELIVSSGLAERLVHLPAILASEDDLLRYHTPGYLRRLRALSAAQGGQAGPDAFLGPGGYDIARLAAGGCIQAVRAVLTGTVGNAYALVRPCGHHATRDSGAGFGIFSNVAVAVLHAKAVGGVERVAVVDWDAHHGNGTQDAFYDDPSVLTISLHQDGAYPARSGATHETGEGTGRGYNINVPLPPGSGHGAYVAAVERVVLPALGRFGPELIVVASGLDANGMDPVARMMCTSNTYRLMARMVKEAAGDLCGGRLVACHEGGYSEKQAAFCGLAVLEALSGIETGMRDPSLHWISGFAGQSLQPHQDAAVRRSEQAAFSVATAESQEVMRHAETPRSGGA